MYVDVTGMSHIGKVQHVEGGCLLPCKARNRNVLSKQSRNIVHTYYTRDAYVSIHVYTTTLWKVLLTLSDNVNKTISNYDLIYGGLPLTLRIHLYIFF